MARAKSLPLTEQPTLYELLEQVDVGIDWYLLGIQLKLDHRRLDAINVQHCDISMKLCKMYELWLETNPNATRRQLIEALRRKGINDIAKSYEKYCCLKGKFAVI